jgi:hypothetical protein
MLYRQAPIPVNGLRVRATLPVSVYVRHVGRYKLERCESSQVPRDGLIGGCHIGCRRLRLDVVFGCSLSQDGPGDSYLPGDDARDQCSQRHLRVCPRADTSTIPSTAARRDCFLCGRLFGDGTRRAIRHNGQYESQLQSWRIAFCRTKLERVSLGFLSGIGEIP